MSSIPNIDQPSSVDIFRNIGDPQRVDQEKLEDIRQKNLQNIALGSNLGDTIQLPNEGTHNINPELPVHSDDPTAFSQQNPPALPTEPPDVPDFGDESVAPEPFIHDPPQAWPSEGERSPYLPKERNGFSPPHPSPPNYHQNEPSQASAKPSPPPFEKDPTLDSMREDYNYRSSRWQPGRPLRDDPDYAEKQELLARIDELRQMGYTMPPMDYSVDVADMQALISRKVVSMSTISTVDMIIHWIRQGAKFAQMVLGFILPETYSKDVDEGTRTPQFRYAIYQLVVRYQTGKNSGPWRIILMVLLAPIIQGIITKLAQLFTGGKFKVPAGIVPGMLKRFMPKPENNVEGLNSPPAPPPRPTRRQNPFSKPHSPPEHQQQQEDAEEDVEPMRPPPPPQMPPVNLPMPQPHQTMGGGKPPPKRRLKRPSEINSNIITESQLESDIYSTTRM